MARSSLSTGRARRPCLPGRRWVGRGTLARRPEFNPPIDDAFLEFLTLPHISHDSRLPNSALAMGSQGVFPARARAGFVHHDSGTIF